MFAECYLQRFQTKLGLITEHADDTELIGDLLSYMEQGKTDFTNTFRALSRCSVAGQESGALDQNAQALVALFPQHQDITNWLKRWYQRHENETADVEKRAELMRTSNPAYIPRNHRVEQIISAAEQHDYAPMHRLIHLLSTPYNERPGMDEFTNPPEEDEIVRATFCGT